MAAAEPILIGAALVLAQAAAAVGLGAALVLWVAGDDPGRYEIDRSSGPTEGGEAPAPKPSASLVPVAGGGAALFGLSF